MTRRFEDKVVVITGGGAGIGRTYARRFAGEGAHIVLGDLDPDAGERTARELNDNWARALAVTMDVASDTDAEAMAKRAVEVFGGIDVLINNAAMHLQHARVPFTREALGWWRQVLDVNVVGALNCTLACRDAMRERGGGAVLNQSSMAAYSTTGAYGISKLALNGLTVALATELADDQIRVNGVAPTIVDSEAAMAEWPEERRAPLVARQAIKRLGRTEDVANVALFLCSEEAGFITGQTVLVDGGATKKPY